MTPRFVLAKYVPDLSRMEPRNIGVFLWAKGEMRAKFLPSIDAEFIADKATYHRWVAFWERTISGDTITPRRGKGVPKKNPECLDALVSTQDGQYILVDAGDLLQPIRKSELDQATSFLFDELVGTQPARLEQASVSFGRRCDLLFHRSGIDERDDFHPKFRVEVPVYGVKRSFRFSYGIGNGTPLAVFQRVVLSKQQSVNSAALMLHEITDDAVVDPQNCAALVQTTEINSELAEEGYEWLSKICRVVDVDDESSADRLKSFVPA